MLDAELAQICGVKSYGGPADALAAVRAFADSRPRLPDRAALHELRVRRAERAAREERRGDSSTGVEGRIWTRPRQVLGASVEPPAAAKPLGVSDYEDALAALAGRPEAAAFARTARAAFPDADAFCA